MEISGINSVLTSPINYTLVTQTVKPKTVPDAIPIPEGMPIRKRVASEFGIEILDTDVKFLSPELLVIEDVLKRFKKRKQRHHLIGVKQVVKNKEGRIKLLKTLVHAGVAYDSDNKRIYLFDNLELKDIPEVLTHEIGHAVNHFNLEFAKFMQFTADSGYNMLEFRKYFAPGNRMYQIAIKKVEIPKDKWQDVVERFNLKSLARNEDVFGEIVVDNGKKKKHPWDENPLEKFAWVYEWFIDKNEEFRKLAQRSAEDGDYTWINDYEFLEKEIFANEEQGQEGS
jgi:hypothetical protein